MPEVYSMRGLSLSCPWFPVLGRRWPLYSDDSGKIQFTENVNGGNAYRSKSIPFSRKEKQAPSRAAMESIGICVRSNTHVSYGTWEFRLSLRSRTSTLSTQKANSLSQFTARLLNRKVRTPVLASHGERGRPCAQGM